VKRYGDYGRKASRIVKTCTIWKKRKLNSENIWKKGRSNTDNIWKYGRKAIWIFNW
jgi:hypothetical protein